ncbi:MAG: hypothetical protein HW380_1820 [Magnetococcales bacterium]|nr:hypothetical protein [Magnetococcales bacterium]
MSETGAVPAKDLIDIMIKSSERAFRQHYNISGWWLDDAPEYFLTSSIALAFAKNNRVPVLMEQPVWETLSIAAALPHGRRRNDDRRTGRFDLVLYWGKGDPRGIVEIKSPLYSADKGRILPDIKRLCDSMRKKEGSQIQFSVFLYYASASDPKQKYDSAGESLKHLTERIHEIVQENVSGDGLVALSRCGKPHEEEEPGAWIIAAEVLVRKGSEQSFK